MPALNTPRHERVFATLYSSTSRWDPGSYHEFRWSWPQNVMRPISSVFKRRKQRVDKSNTNFSELMPITIHFDGSIEPRNVSDDYDYVMDLFYDKPGDIVVSKIDLKNGAVAIIPDGWNNAVVTNHFMVYQPNLDVINPQYFLQIIQANFFKNYLWRNKVGAEGRKEVKIDFLESVHIPAPQISVQNKICNY
jgi:type I restriction enzyme, S subunit